MGKAGRTEAVTALGDRQEKGAIPGEHLGRIYESRFPAIEAVRKDAIWREITGYLQRFIDPAGVVLDVACDRGDFIRNIRAAEKWATDLRDVSSHLTADVRFTQANGLELDEVLPKSYFDVIFISNYLEHLPSATSVIDQLAVVRRLLKPHGRVIVLQPNIRLIGGSYWDFIDHTLALTDRSLVAAGQLAGLSTANLVVRFLPFTTRSRLPQHPLLVRAYLYFPPAWLLMGKQTLYIGEPAAATNEAPPDTLGHGRQPEPTLAPLDSDRASRRHQERV